MKSIIIVIIIILVISIGLAIYFITKKTDTSSNKPTTQTSPQENFQLPDEDKKWIESIQNSNIPNKDKAKFIKSWKFMFNPVNDAMHPGKELYDLESTTTSSTRGFKAFCHQDSRPAFEALLKYFTNLTDEDIDKNNYIVEYTLLWVVMGFKILNNKERFNTDSWKKLYRLEKLRDQREYDERKIQYDKDMADIRNDIVELKAEKELLELQGNTSGVAEIDEEIKLLEKRLGVAPKPESYVSLYDELNKIPPYKIEIECKDSNYKTTSMCNINTTKAIIIKGDIKSINEKLTNEEINDEYLSFVPFLIKTDNVTALMPANGRIDIKEMTKMVRDRIIQDPDGFQEMLEYCNGW